MDNFFSHHRISILVFIILITACGGGPDIVSRDKKEGAIYSADEIRHVTVDQPFLLSGDYFRNREQPAQYNLNIRPEEVVTDAAPVVRLSDLEAKAAQKSDRRRMGPKTNPSSPPRQENPSAEPTGLPLKFGFMFDPKGVPVPYPPKLLSTIPALERSYPIVFADPGRVMETLSQTGCLEKRDMGCAAAALGRFPGVRVILFVEQIVPPDAFPGKFSIRYAIIDTGIPRAQPLTEYAAKLPDAAAVDSFLMNFAQNAVSTGIQAASLMPSFCRVFSRKEKKWFITAGKRSGLAPGDLLDVVADFETVLGPFGAPAGVMAGKRVGRIRVNTLFGRDFSACQHLSGRPPGPDDYLMKPRIESAEDGRIGKGKP
jgi:hypothetical protein